MHRSASTTRASEELFQQQRWTTSTLMMGKLPTYDPLSEVAKKEACRARSAENAVHFIPLVLVACALVLWFFSRPHVPIETKIHALDERNLTLDGISHEAYSALETGGEGVNPVEHRVGTGRKRRTLLEN